ncbi:hypothetical protein Anapl_04188 [Anas platyrhynchos]|uniref:Uncharacterized protein n=1 Tax=Anas platyrhynchos TaxID=8839 RepID=R0KZZ1_ANAPL|nr:hypothetical protein Anapl_04188 [Anas platyrhynchos]
MTREAISIEEQDTNCNFKSDRQEIATPYISECIQVPRQSLCVPIYLYSLCKPRKGERPNHRRSSWLVFICNFFDGNGATSSALLPATGRAALMLIRSFKSTTKPPQLQGEGLNQTKLLRTQVSHQKHPSETNTSRTEEVSRDFAKGESWRCSDMVQLPLPWPSYLTACSEKATTVLEKRAPLHGVDVGKELLVNACLPAQHRPCRASSAPRARGCFFAEGQKIPSRGANLMQTVPNHCKSFSGLSKNKHLMGSLKRFNCGKEISVHSEGDFADNGKGQAQLIGAACWEQSTGYEQYTFPNSTALKSDNMSIISRGLAAFILKVRENERESVRSSTGSSRDVGWASCLAISPAFYCDVTYSSNGLLIHSLHSRH